MYLNRGPAVEKRLVIDTERQVLRVPNARSVGVEDIRIFYTDRKNPIWDWDGDNISDIATTLMERHNGLNSEATLLDKIKQFDVRTPVVLFRPFGLNNPPPHIHHDAVDAGFPQLPQLLLQLLRLGQFIFDRDHFQLSA